MAGIGDLFGKGSIAEQFLIWGVMQQLLQPLLQPAMTELGILVNDQFPVTPLTPADAAQHAARGLVSQDDGAATARKSGVDSEPFGQLVDAARTSPALGLVVEALQRGYIDTGSGDPKSASLHGALADHGIRESWWPIIDRLAVQIPSVAEVMNAWLEGQIDESEARRRYLEAGGDPTWFQTSYNANGTAPTPMEALEMLNRGLIPQDGTGPDSVSFHQAFLEGPWRNKWEPVMLGLKDYYPPPRTVTAMFHAGQLTHDQAATYLAKQGLTPDLIAAYLSPTHSQTATTDKHLAKTDLLALYADQLITPAQLTKGLTDLGYTAHDADLVVKLADVRLAAAQVTSGVAHVRSLFEAGKLTETEAQQALVQLHVDAAQAQQIVATWTISLAPKVRTPTAAQLVDAWYYQLLPADVVLGRIEQLGYDSADAYLLLAVRNHGPVQGIPAPPGFLPPSTTAGATA